jgi:hypothetical protein
MNETAVRALQDIVTDRGRKILQDARQCQALLQDHSPSTRRENMALMEALKANIPPRLLALPPASLSEATIAKFAACLSGETALSAEAARWAVLSWAKALGLTVATGGPGHPILTVPKGTGAEAGFPSMEEVWRRQRDLGLRPPGEGGLQQVQRPQVGGSSAGSAEAVIKFLLVFVPAAIAGLGVWSLSAFAVCGYMVACGDGRAIGGIGLVVGLAGIGAFRIVWWLLTK